VPEELVYLTLPPGRDARLCPLVSSGLACGRWGQPVLLRGLQEAIERDAVVGASWGSYPLAECDAAKAFAMLGPDVPARLKRPNLHYRFFRVATPYSAHVTVVMLEGEDHGGYLFSVGSACRETRTTSWAKAALEAVQGRHYVRYLKGRHTGPLDVPASFAEHALYYTVHPERLDATVLRKVGPATDDPDELRTEALDVLIDRLGPDRRVLVPGLQPLHGHHALPFLGGPLWAPRTWNDWTSMPPHPFP
jgi:ribosomal protein S12 methylthiotransferase accessory factor YcaO